MDGSMIEWMDQMDINEWMSGFMDGWVRTQTMDKLLDE